MKIVLKYIGYIMAVVGFATVIWKAAVYFNNKDTDTTVLKSDVSIIKQAMVSQGTKIDSLYFGQRKIMRKVERIESTGRIVKTQLGNHIIKTSNDKQDIINWFNATEEKKNSNEYLFQIPADTGLIQPGLISSMKK